MHYQEEIMEVKSMVSGYRDELVSRLGRLVAIQSVEGTPLADAPFGSGPRDALKAALDMTAADGFRTVNLDNYIGYAEMGEGDQIIGIIGHLDVVPANADDWQTDPFSMPNGSISVAFRSIPTIAKLFFAVRLVGLF